MVVPFHLDGADAMGCDQLFTAPQTSRSNPSVSILRKSIALILWVEQYWSSVMILARELSAFEPRIDVIDS